MATRKNLKWQPILARAKEIINSYDTGVTLRQLFYRLVSEGLLPNTESYYHGLSREKTKAQRSGNFPPQWLREPLISANARKIALAFSQDRITANLI